MRAMASLAFFLAVTLTLCVAGFFSASALMAKPASDIVTRIDTPDLWPATVKRITTADRSMERLPAATVSLAASENLALAETPPTETLNTAAEIDQTAPGALADANGHLAMDQATASPEHQSWCERRYRSYSAGDNSYNSYSGERKACVSPYMDVASTTDIGRSVSSDVLSLPDDHARRCQARYASYRVSDNSYQPYGGRRRTCDID